LSAFGGADYRPAAQEEIDKVGKRHCLAEKVYRGRKKVVLEALGSLAEGCERKPRELGEEIGIEFDDSAL
jgi:hypothetical protein